MRHTLLIVLLLAVGVPVAAQSPDAGPFAKRTAMLLVGGAVSVGTVVVADQAPAMLLLVPLTTGLAFYGTGLALRADGRLGRTLGGAALGALPGAVLVLAGALPILGDGCSDPFVCGGAEASLMFAGAVLYLVGPPIGAVIGFGSVETVYGRFDLVPGTRFGPSVPTAGLRVRF